MSAIPLILTSDYEIFGNGTGCVDDCLLAPSDEMAQTCERYGARMTFFVDVIEIWQFKQDYESGLIRTDLAGNIESQLQDLKARGHDVQLHFHPQWLDASYAGKKEWKVNNQFWRLPEVDNHKEWTLDRLFEAGKSYLEQLLQPIDSNYQCDVFRAGAWCIQPELKVLAAMEKHGFKIDSTVAKGIRIDDGLTKVDFSLFPDLPVWKVKDSVTQESQEGKILEVPISTVRMGGFRNLFFLGLKFLKRIPHKPEGCEKGGKSKKVSKWQKIKSALSPQYKMLNICDASSFEEMQWITKRLINETYDSKKAIVAIGHPKTFGNIEEFDRYLKWVSQTGKVRFESYSMFK